MKITHGLLPGQVLQRNSHNRGGARITGVCQAAGDVELKVTHADAVVKKFGWHTAGTAADGTFSAQLENLQTGGPYQVKLRIRSGGKSREKLSIREVFVGDVWILAGQSNMEGIGNLKDAPKAQSKVRAFYMRDEWDVAREKLHFLQEAVDPVHNSYGDGPDRPSKEELARTRGSLIKGVGPGHAFGLEMFKRTRVPQGLIPSAHGGTSMGQWSPALKDKGGASLYGAMLRRYQKLGQPVAGILWYQGESDAHSGRPPLYTERMIELVKASRDDMNCPELPWLVVQLGCHASPGAGEGWNSIQEQQRRLPEKIQCLDLAPTVDLQLDDGIHISGKSQQVLGCRLARLAERLVHGNKKAKPGIRLHRIRLVPPPHCNPGAPCTSVELSYANAVGGLQSAGRPWGFALLNSRGEDLCAVFKSSLKGKRVLLHTNMPKHLLETLSVSYGVGLFPYCNIRDKEDMSLPVMQAVPINPEHPPICSDWETGLLPTATTLAQVDYDQLREVGDWQEAPPRGGFGVLPKPAGADTVGVFAMRTSLTAEAPMQARLLFGANAPFRIWLNGSPLLSDLEAGIPMDAEQYRADLDLRKGMNEIMLAFAPPSAGAHFGISARVGTLEEKAAAGITLKNHEQESQG